MWKRIVVVVDDDDDDDDRDDKRVPSPDRTARKLNGIVHKIQRVHGRYSVSEHGLVNESTVHAKGWVMIPRSDRNGKKIEDECDKKHNAGSNAMDKLRKHYELPGTPGKDTMRKRKRKRKRRKTLK